MRKSGESPRRPAGRLLILAGMAWASAVGMVGAQAPAVPPPAVPNPAVPAAPAPATPNPGNAAPAPPPPANPAFFVPRIASHMETGPGGSAVAVLTVNETEAAVFRVAAGGFSPQQRADIAAQRLLSLLQAGLRPDEITAQPDVKPAWKVAARGGTLLMATQDDADARKMTPKALALAWQKALRSLLSEPPLTLSAKTLIVPLGETRTVTVGGAVLPTDVQVKDNSPTIGAALYDPVHRTLTIRGQTVGSDSVTVVPAATVGGGPLILPVRVMQYAGTVAGAVTVEVTGDPAPPDVVKQAAYLGLTQALNLQPGALLAVSAPPRDIAALTPNGQAAAAFPVRLTGDNLLPVDAKSVVTVVDSSITSPPPSALLYSNSPEQVKRPQTLFTADIGAGTTVRLDFHHQNMSGQLMAFHADLVNTSGAPASAQVIAGVSLPGADTVQVGRRAGAAFLNNLNADAGLVLTVPPHGSVPLMTQRFAPGLTLSGIMQIQSLSGGGLSVVIRASEDLDTLASSLWQICAANDGGTGLAAPSGSGAVSDAGPLSAAVFARPQINVAGHYAVDGRWAFVPLGDKDALHSLAGGLRLFGNYGADYNVTLTLTNPTAAARSVGVYFAPAAGLTAGIFQVDGGPVLEYAPFEPPDERQLDLVTLAPGETRVVHLRTIALNGSSYPAQIVARALDKPPAPPVIPAVPPPAATISALVPGKAAQ